MNEKKSEIRDPDMAGVGPALLRAAKRAREIAARTHTPLVYYENGRVIKEMIVRDKDRQDS
jgi:hypothetical protein